MMRSMLGWLVVVAAASFLSACGIRYAVFPETEEYLVGRGDTLYSIAWKKELDPDDLARWNGLQPPYRLFLGQSLTLNASGAVANAGSTKRPAPARPVPPRPPTKTTPLSRTPVVTKPVAPITPSPSRPTQPKPVNQAPQIATSAAGWAWPATGKVRTADIEGRQGRQGLEIQGAVGQNIRAARSGKVVYAGSALKGYGQLVIVKHDDVYLSAYGYNSQLLIRDGDSVKVGQVIAKMGMGPRSEPLLYFEIRKKGRPISALTLLPKQ